MLTTGRLSLPVQLSTPFNGQEATIGALPGKVLGRPRTFPTSRLSVMCRGTGSGRLGRALTQGKRVHRRGLGLSERRPASLAVLQRSAAMEHRQSMQLDLPRTALRVYGHLPYRLTCLHGPGGFPKSFGYHSDRNNGLGRHRQC